MDRKQRLMLDSLPGFRAIVAASVSVFAALTVGASGQAHAQCVGGYHSNSGSGVHAPPSPTSGVHSATSAPSVHTGSASCSTGATPTVHVSPFRAANLNPAAAKPALGRPAHWHAMQHENAHAVRPNSKGKP